MYNFHHIGPGPYHHAAGNTITVDDSNDVEHSPSRLHTQSTSSQVQSTPSLLSVPVKIINPDKKSKAKLYMLRNNLGTLTDFKDMIFEQFGEEVVSSELDFEIGFYRNECGSEVLQISMITSRKLFVLVTALLCGAWVYLKSTNEGDTGMITLIQIQSMKVMTCNNVHDLSLKKKKTKHEEKLERVDELDELKVKHGTYTNIQYRVWAETIEA